MFVTKIANPQGVAKSLCLGWCISLDREAVVESLRRREAALRRDECPGEPWGGVPATPEGAWKYAEARFGDVASFNEAHEANLRQFSHFGRILVFDNPVESAGGDHVPLFLAVVEKMNATWQAAVERLGEYLTFCGVSHEAVSPELTLIAY